VHVSFSDQQESVDWNSALADKLGKRLFPEKNREKDNMSWTGRGGEDRTQIKWGKAEGIGETIGNNAFFWAIDW